MGQSLFERQLQRKVLVLDGAMGTMIQQAALQEDDFGGAQYDGCNEYLCITRPDVIAGIHRAYYEAGADIIETNTFGSMSIVLDEYGLKDRAREITLAAARLAVQERDAVSTEQWPRFVAGALGPTTKTLCVTGGVTFDALIASYEEQAIALIDGGVDVLLMETSQDTLNVKAGCIALHNAFAHTGKHLPIMLSCTIEPMGTMLAGQPIESFLVSLEHVRPVVIGLNCATGPEFMRDHIRTLSERTDAAIVCYPNAGLPDELGMYHESPQSLARKLAAFGREGWINVVGGCCGTTPAHIRAIADAFADIPPRSRVGHHPPAVSGIETVFREDAVRPVLVGERTNVIGSRKFKRLIMEGKLEEASEIARAQVKKGAQIIDINVQDTEIDERVVMGQLMQLVAKKVKVPIMIDSTDAEAIHVALRHAQGKCIINSINMEDGLGRFDEVVPLMHRYGAAVVVGLIDEQGMAVWADDKLRVALRAFDVLVHTYGVRQEDIIFDPNVFPVGSGDPQYIGSAAATIEGIRLIRAHLPQCATVLGISNVSFGLPEAGREVLNAVFLYHCTKAGLDYAIVNTEKCERYASIPEHERALAERLLFETSDETLAQFTAHFREVTRAPKVAATALPLEDRLAACVIEGTKEGLVADLSEALTHYAPLDIINGPLMRGMDRVGQLFGNNELIVAEVLQSAEVMKAAVAFLEPHMEQEQTASKGKVLLATVKGDVHDIGKNLVEIILANNGYEIVNLGIKVPSQDIIEAVRMHNPDMVGLSGLLVKSAQQMVLTAADLRDAGISVPILVGGAALTRKFTKTRIAPMYHGPVLYAKDAMDGLALANGLMDPEERIALIDQAAAQAVAAIPDAPVDRTVHVHASSVRRDVPIKVPRDCQRHVLRSVPVHELWQYVNMRMLLGHHLGLKGNVEALLEQKDPKAMMLLETVQTLLEQGFLRAHGVYRFFPAQSEGDRLIIYDPDDHASILHTFTFPRQRVAPYLCLSDYVRPKSGEMDYVGMFVVTTGAGVRAQAERLKADGAYVQSHAVQALAIEMAEAFAERMHQRMRDDWGIGDDPTMRMADLFAARYVGQRFSFGYPACPALEDQGALFSLLEATDIGVALTEEWMMEPEASVSAIVFSHPEARYFNVEKEE
ncbi:MAG: methionine synthase [Paenibacillaceae bacterium]|nr:methionine synthase [Paenibacillaceae bacterium]